MKICIVGTGTMGHGIAQVFAQAGHEVLLKGRSEASLAKAHKAMDKNLSRMVEKGKLEAGVKDQVLARIKDSMKYEDCADADLVIEAIAEDMATKHEIFKLLDGICKPEAILATNTSSLSITEVAAVTNRPEKVIGMHFFNPVPAMKLVEVIKGRLTSAVRRRARTLFTRYWMIRYPTHWPVSVAEFSPVTVMLFDVSCLSL